jgi:hypothetical protein
MRAIRRPSLAKKLYRIIWKYLSNITEIAETFSNVASFFHPGDNMKIRVETLQNICVK